MGMLDRYKKTGGFLQILNLMETCGPAKQEKFFTLIDAESPTWGKAIRQKMLSVDKVVNWADEILLEITSRLKDITLATARHGLDENSWKRMSRGITASRMRLIDEIYNSKKASAAEVGQAFQQILIEVRDMVKHGYVRLDKVDPELHVPENIEDQLNRSDKEIGFTASLQNSETMVDAQKEVESENPNATASEKQGLELAKLRQKVVSLDNQNREMRQELTDLRTKLDRVKKIVA